MRYLVITILIFLINGCPFASDQFFMNKFDKETETVIGLRLNGWEKVKQINQNSFLIEEGGLAAIASPIPAKNDKNASEILDGIDDLLGHRVTYKKYFTFDFGLKKISDAPLHIHSRTTPTDFNKNELGINFRIFENTVSIFDGEKLIKDYNLSSFKKNETKRMIVMNFDSYIKVSLDCDEILNYKTERPITEYLLFHSVGSGDWEINAVSTEKNIPEGLFKYREIVK